MYVPVCVCVCVCVYVCVCVCVCASVCCVSNLPTYGQVVRECDTLFPTPPHIYTYVYMYIPHERICMHILQICVYNLETGSQAKSRHIHTHSHTLTHIHTHIHTHTHSHSHTHTLSLTHTHAHTLTHTCIHTSSLCTFIWSPPKPDPRE